MLKIVSKHKCGCEWVTVFIKGASKREIKQLHASAARTDCPKCEGKKEDPK